MTDKTCKICGYDDVIEGKDICKFCENAQAAISDVEMRKSVSVDLHKFSSLFSKEGDYVEVTEWTNGEGFDICLYTSETNQTDGEFYDYTPITKAEYKEILTILRSESEELQPLLDVKKQIDNKICKTHRMIWMKFPQISIQSQNTIIQ